MRFTHQGRRYDLSTGEREAGAAALRAAVIYADVVAGRLAPRAKAGNARGPALDALCAEWLESLETSRDKGTVNSYEIYARHWLARFSSLASITTASAEDYAKRRLARVIRRTVAKELSALRSFLAWCYAQGSLGSVPTIHAPPKSAVGHRYLPKRKLEAVELSESEALAIIRALPRTSRKQNGRLRRPRAYFSVLWETGLRPKTVGSLSCPEHYSRGAHELTITDDIDKARYGRKLPLTPAARAALDEACPKRGLVFPTTDFRVTLKRAGEVAGLAPEKVARLTAYDFRHARATDIAQSTGDLPGTAYLLGHRQLTTTNKYLHPSRRAGDRVMAAILVRDSGATPQKGFSKKDGQEQ